MVSSRSGLAPQILVGFFFKGPKKKANLKKIINKNYKGQVPLSKHKISTNQADLKKKKVMMVRGPPN
jgi:hypothetical protein